MQSALSSAHAAAAGRPLAVARRPVVAVSAHSIKLSLHGRRSLVASMLGAALLLAGRADARDFKEALAAKEARKAKLRASAGDIAKTGKDQQIFKGSDYEVAEDSKTPNSHSRQNEGARTQENA